VAGSINEMLKVENLDSQNDMQRIPHDILHMLEAYPGQDLKKMAICCCLA